MTIVTYNEKQWIADGGSHITFNFHCPVDLRSIIDEDVLLWTVRNGEPRRGPVNLSSIWVVHVNKTWIEAWNPQCYQSRDGKREKAKFLAGCWQPYKLIQSLCLSVCPWTWSLGWTLWHALCMKPLKSLSLEFKSFLKLWSMAIVFLSHCKSHKTTKISERKTFIYDENLLINE